MATVVQPLCYYVYATAEGWEVALDHEQPLRTFPSQQAAIAAARIAAEARWLLTRSPTSVRLGRRGGDNLIDCDYG